jgi:hypothetical protein
MPTTFYERTHSYWPDASVPPVPDYSCPPMSPQMGLGRRRILLQIVFLSVVRNSGPLQRMKEEQPSQVERHGSLTWECDVHSAWVLILGVHGYVTRLGPKGFHQQSLEGVEPMMANLPRTR